jgi:predicted enzyme related to lactoylglutathione lyase
VTDMDAAVKAAKAHGADVIVDAFPDPIGRDAIVSWPGGVHMQLYWHTQAPHYDALQTVPENRVYVSAGRADALVRDFTTFAHGKVLSDVRNASGVEIGRPGDTFRRIRIESGFGKMTVLVTDGHLPYPFGHEVTGYEVNDLASTLQKAQAAGAAVLVSPFTSGEREAALVRFPGGYIAEIHARQSSPANDTVHR